MSEVEDYLRSEHGDAAELALWARAVVLAAEPDFLERVYRGWRGIGFRHPEAGYVCAIYPKGERVDLLFEHGAAMHDPEQVLTGKGSQTATFTVAAANADTEHRIRQLVQQAVAERLLASGL